MSSRSSITSSKVKEKAKAAEIMVKVPMLEQRQELENRAERLRLEEQLAVAQVHEHGFSDIENGIKEDLSHQPELPPEAFCVQGFSLSGPSFPPMSSTYTAPSAMSNTVMKVNFTAGCNSQCNIQR